MAKKYASLSTLQNLVSNIKSLFATKADVNAELAKKANVTHAHTISEVTNLQSSLDSKVSTSRTINSKPLSANITLSASDVGAAPASHDHNSVYYTQTQLDQKLANKSDKTHNHDSDYAGINHNHDGVYSLASHNHDTKYEPKGTASSSVSAHNTSTTSHADIRDLITGLTTRLNTLANSDDTTLDQLSEIVAYVKNNKSLIDGVTTSKVNVADIINNLTTNVANKPLSAAQGVVIQKLINDLQAELDSHKHTVSEISDLTATATELNYMDGVTSNVQTQLDSLSSDLEDHTHSASDITSGTMDAARLPKASGTVAGIMSTGTQTIAGTKTFTSQIKPAGVLTSGHITASADSTYSIGSATSAFNNAYINSLFINPERVNGSAIFGGSFEVEKTGTDTQVGIAKLKVGNPTKEGIAGNARGYIQIYNENNGSVTLETNHSDDYAFRVSLPTTTGRLVTNNEVYTKADQHWNLLYDSGEISAIANSISNIDVSGYTNIQVLVRCYNDGDSINSRAGSAIFTCTNGKTYQFPVWSSMFSKSINTVYTMATFNLVDGWLVCPYASRLIGDANTFEDEGGTAGNLALTGSGMMKCTSQLSKLTVSSLDQNSNYYFGMGSRVMVWGWNA